MPRLRPGSEIERSVDDRTAKIETQTRERQKALWAALNEFVRASGGWVVSAPSLKHMRIEAPEGSGLGERLTAAGYKVDHRGVGMRLVGDLSRFDPNRRRGTGDPQRRLDGQMAVEIFEIVLP